MRNLEECDGYKSLLAAVERDEKNSPGFHNYREKLSWVVRRVNHYAEKTGLDPADILDVWEKGRSYWYMNYYQDCEQPLLDGDKAHVFDDIKSFMDSVGKEGFRCPLCGGISKNPYACDTGIIVKKIKDGKDGPCNWKVGGLFKDLGKGVFIFIKTEMRGETIFSPVAWEKTKTEKTA